MMGIVLTILMRMAVLLVSYKEKKFMMKEVNVSLSSTEFIIILECQVADKSLFKKLTNINDDLLNNRPNFKRVNVIFNERELDLLISHIAKEGNRQNNTYENQYLFDCLFVKLTDKHQLLSFS